MGLAAMKLGMTSLTFRNEEIQAVFEYARRANIEGIEWGVCDKHIRLGDKERISLVKELSKKNNIEIFSLGSYCDMTDFEECDKTLETARMLNAPIIRLWAGKKGTCDCDKEYYNKIIENSKKMAVKAEKLSVMLCFEYHHNTLTDGADAAIKLVKEINRYNVGLYWQPQWRLSYEENIAEVKKVIPYVTKNIHLSNYSAENGYGLLCDIENELRGYFAEIKGSDYNLFIEFVKDASVDSLISDALTIRKIIGK